MKLRLRNDKQHLSGGSENLYIRKDAAYKGHGTEAAREVMRELVDRMESDLDPPATISKKLLELRRNCAQSAAKSNMDISKAT